MLKKYQERVIKEVEAYLRQLAQEAGDFAPSIAWMKLAAQLRLSPNYQRRVNGLGTVSWEELGKAFKNQVFRFQVVDQGQYEHKWKERLDGLLTRSGST